MNHVLQARQGAILAKGKLQMEESRKLGRICPDTGPAYLSRACFDVHYVRYSDAVGKPTVCFISYLPENSSTLFVFNILSKCSVSCYEILPEISRGFANNVDVSFHLDLPIM